ncbi:MAG: TIM barrel protein [Chlamydiota bacterium]
MFALSTSWNADGRFTARGLLTALAGIGLREIELSYHCTAAEVREYDAGCRAMGIRVVSVHNFSPVPDAAPARRARSEALLLSSPDAGEHRSAVEATKRSIATAASLGAKVLIVHLGRVEVPSRTRELIRMYREGLKTTRRYRALSARMAAQRAAVARRFFDNAVRSLDDLCAAAADAGVVLAVENRFYHREVPSCEELRELLRRFDGGPVGYWHDIGHAQVMENLGFCRHEEYLDAAGGALRGFHIHDVLLCEDHLPPSCGMVDFSRFTGRMGRGELRVVELAPTHGVAAVERGVRFMQRVLEDSGAAQAAGKGEAHGAKA